MILVIKNILFKYIKYFKGDLNMLTSLLISGIIVSGASIVSIIANNGKEVDKNTGYSRSYDDSDYIRYNSNDSIIFSKEDEIDYAQETYDYLRYMTTDEIEEYVNYNDVLSRYDYKIYGTCNKDNKDLVLKHICDIAEKEGRSFTNKYSRY
jgi:hypothetical protein